MARDRDKITYGLFSRSVLEGGWLTPVPCFGRSNRWLTWRKSRILEAYLIMVGLVAAATMARHSAGDLVRGAQFPTFFLAVIVSTLQGGMTVGLASVALSTISAWYFILSPDRSFDLPQGQSYALGAFVCVATLMTLLIASLQTTNAVAAEARAQAAASAERARVAEELRQWKKIFDNIAVGIALSDPEDDTFIMANSAFAAVHGLAVEKIAGTSIFDTYPADERARIAQLAAAADRDGSADFEACRLRSNGSIFPARVHVTSVPRTDDAAPYRIVTTTDITHERELEARLSQVFNDVAIGISIVDAASNITRYVNPAYAVAHGAPAEEMHGRSVFEVYQPADRELIAGLNEIADRDGEINYEAEHVRKDGSVFPARVHVTSVRAPDGELRYRIATVQDATRERELQTRLGQAQRLESIGRLSAGVAHDFNNLLQGMISHLELIDDDLSPATQERIGTAIRLAEQGGALVQQLLSFGRKQLLLPREIMLHGFMRDFASMLSRTLDPRIRVELAVAPDVGALWADPTHLRSALLNLAINSRDAMPSGGTLFLEVGYTDASNDRVVFRVIDTGTGIAQEDLSKVCEPFFSSKGLNGSGLGLSMVHGFVKQSGGDFHIASEIGTGTRVELTLPVHSGQEQTG